MSPPGARRRRAAAPLPESVAALLEVLGGRANARAARPGDVAVAWRRALRESLIAWALGGLTRRWALGLGLDPHGLRLLEPPALPLASDPEFEALVAGGEAELDALAAPPASAPGPTELAARLIAVQERLLDFELAPEATSPRRRKRSGSYYTPPALAERVVAAALAPLEVRLASLPAARARDTVLALRACDPAAGGGVFLIEVCRRLAHLAARGRGDTADAVSTTADRRLVATQCVFGCDVDPLAVATAEAALWLFVADPELSPATFRARVVRGDALVGRGPLGDPGGEPSTPPGSAPLDWTRIPPTRPGGAGFDLVVGNPPWVAFAGRAAQPLAPERRRYFAAQYRAWRGYPTLHGLFVARAAALAPAGVVALIVPSPLADLDGYRALRLSLTERHVVREPLVELGQDAFAAVVQPSMILLADPHPEARPSAERWRLQERTRAVVAAALVAPPASVLAAETLAPLPAETFRELGFQSNRAVTGELLRRAAAPDPTYDYPLLEGRDVTAFRVGPPRLFLVGDRARVAAAGARVRDRAAYVGVDFVVRQTAAFPIAARHSGVPFRNSLLAGFASPGLEADLLIGLLNSTWFRALHLARQRDARQAAFPQVKLSHLRGLPAPPPVAAARARVAAAARALTQSRAGNPAPEPDPELTERLDRAVFDLYAIDAPERDAVCAFARAFAPAGSRRARSRA